MNPILRPLVAKSPRVRQFFYWCVRERLLQLESDRRIYGEGWLKDKSARKSHQIQHLYTVKQELEELDQ